MHRSSENAGLGEFVSHFGTGVLLIWPVKAHACVSRKEANKLPSGFLQKQEVGLVGLAYLAPLCCVLPIFIYSFVLLVFLFCCKLLFTFALNISPSILLRWMLP